MTDRQFVRKHFPYAELNFVVETHNLHRPTCYYRILTVPPNEGLGVPKILARAEFRKDAWRKAKIKLKQSPKGEGFSPTPQNGQ